jgi:hypothetical protein
VWNRLQRQAADVVDLPTVEARQGPRKRALRG